MNSSLFPPLFPSFPTRSTSSGSSLVPSLNSSSSTSPLPPSESPSDKLLRSSSTRLTKQTIPYPDGGSYIGEVNGEVHQRSQHGRGSYVDNQGRKYTGIWVNGVPSGGFVFSDRDGTKYEVLYVNGVSKSQRRL